MVPEIHAERTDERCGTWILGTQCFYLYLQIWTNYSICTYRINSRVLRAFREYCKAYRWTLRRMSLWYTIILPLSANSFFCWQIGRPLKPIYLSFRMMFQRMVSEIRAAWCLRSMSLSFMQSVQVNGAAHESLGHNFPDLYLPNLTTCSSCTYRINSRDVP